MEMLKKLDEDTLIDAVGYGKMVQKLSVYNDKLYRDALTGAYNRRYYEDEIKHVKGKAGVVILDVDDFKLYNDMRGHHAWRYGTDYSGRSNTAIYQKDR